MNRAPMAALDLNFDGNPFLPRLPEDRQVVTLLEAAERALELPGLKSFVGAEGSGAALLCHTLLAKTTRQIVYVVANSEVAQQACADLSALGQAQ